MKELRALVRATLSSLDSAKSITPDTKLQLQAGFSIPVKAGDLSVEQAETLVRKFHGALTTLQEVNEAAVVVSTNSFIPGLSLADAKERLERFSKALSEFKDEMIANVALNVMEDSALTTEVLTGTRSSYEAAQKIAKDQEEAAQAKAKGELADLKKQVSG